MDYLAGSQTVSETLILSSTAPVMGESFCHCEGQEELSPGFGVNSDCLCGEEDQGEEIYFTKPVQSDQWSYDKLVRRQHDKMYKYQTVFMMQTSFSHRPSNDL